MSMESLKMALSSHIIHVRRALHVWWPFTWMAAKWNCIEMPQRNREVYKIVERLTGACVHITTSIRYTLMRTFIYCFRSFNWNILIYFHVMQTSFFNNNKKIEMLVLSAIVRVQRVPRLQLAAGHSAGVDCRCFRRFFFFSLLLSINWQISRCELECLYTNSTLFRILTWTMF